MNVCLKLWKSLSVIIIVYKLDNTLNNVRRILGYMTKISYLSGIPVKLSQKIENCSQNSVWKRSNNDDLLTLFFMHSLEKSAKILMFFEERKIQNTAVTNVFCTPWIFTLF